MLKKILSICIVLIFVFTTTIVSAQTKNIDYNKGNLDEFDFTTFSSNMVDREIAESFVGDLDYMGFDIKSINENSRGEAIINVTAANIKSEITIKEASDSETILEIVEGDLQNTVKITDEGDVYLDGSKIEIEYAGEVISDISANQRMYNTTKCPYGSASDYGTKVDSGSSANLLFSKAVKLITFAAFCIVLSEVVFLAGIAATACSIAYDLIKAQDPSSNAMSIKYTKYKHTKKGFNVTSKMSVYKYVTTYYSKKNFGGVKLCNGTTYKVWEY